MNETMQIQLGIATVLSPILSFVLIAALGLRRPTVAKIILADRRVSQLSLRSMLLLSVEDPAFKVQATWLWLMDDPGTLRLAYCLFCCLWSCCSLF